MSSPTWRQFSYGELSELVVAFFFFSLLLFFTGDLQVDNNESPGCAHLIPSGRGEKHHSALGILCLKMVICQLEQILGEQGRWRVDRFHLLYLLNLITGTGLQRGKNILLHVILKEVENMVEIRQRQPTNHSVSLMLSIPVHHHLLFMLCASLTSLTENTLLKGLTFGSLVYFAVFSQFLCK